MLVLRVISVRSISSSFVVVILLFGAFCLVETTGMFRFVCYYSLFLSCVGLTVVVLVSSIVGLLPTILL